MFCCIDAYLFPEGLPKNRSDTLNSWQTSPAPSACCWHSDRQTLGRKARRLTLNKTCSVTSHHFQKSARNRCKTGSLVLTTDAKIIFSTLAGRWPLVSSFQACMAPNNNIFKTGPLHNGGSVLTKATQIFRTVSGRVNAAVSATPSLSIAGLRYPALSGY